MSSRIQNARPCVATTRSSFLDHQIVQGRRREVELRLCQCAPSSKEEKAPVFRRRKEKPAGFAGSSRTACTTELEGTPRSSREPRLAAIGGLVDVGADVIELVPVDRDIGRAGIGNATGSIMLIVLHGACLAA